ncbi:MAG: RdgB/HAM1 family non-canonical purine NTP pyrophosphatase [Proteobacteria bacterium]|nr:RdgB/HAM1 family non-canonical purine NTP pyrophosphatase [Pseudomonadota bacterium]
MTEKQKIVLASNNPGKVREINALLEDISLNIQSQSEFNVPEVEETGLSFVENALIKARNAALHTGNATIADDSGIEILALNGKPGIYSARFAGVGATDEANLYKLIEEIKSLDEKNRQARFVCLMVFLRHADDPTPIIAQGIWDGIVITEPRGKNGFGYDPIFYVPTHDCTSAELPPETKNQLSHRGQALRSLVAQINKKSGL